jgi:hypothetical protein
MRSGIWRITEPAPRMSKKPFTRKRPVPGSS